MLPLFNLVNALSNLITLVVIGSEIYLIHKWYKEDYANYSSYWFLLALFLLLISSLGGVIFPFLFGGKSGEKISKEPEQIASTPKILFTEIYPKPNAPTLIFTHG